MRQCGNVEVRQCGNEGRRALRCGAPAVTPIGSAQAGNAQCPMPNASRSVNCRTAALPHCLIGLVFVTFSALLNIKEKAQGETLGLLFYIKQCLENVTNTKLRLPYINKASAFPVCSIIQAAVHCCHPVDRLTSSRVVAPCLQR